MTSRSCGSTGHVRVLCKQCTVIAFECPCASEPKQITHGICLACRLTVHPLPATWQGINRRIATRPRRRLSPRRRIDKIKIEQTREEEETPPPPSADPQTHPETPRADQASAPAPEAQEPKRGG